jgi:pimeloyl-ACP methyl ester carboxylesterase
MIPCTRRAPVVVKAAAVLLVSSIAAASAHTAEIVTRDTFVNHRSVDGVYARYKLDPTVLLHVREVVLEGNERNAAREGKVIVFAHGLTTPGYIAFDTDCDGCSAMRFFALAGWDTFTLDYEGYGRSTRQPTMEFPEAFPDAPPPTLTEVDVDDLGRAIDYVRNLRGVEKVHLLGWSLAASRTAPIYTIQNPDKVARLVLFAPAYRYLGALFEPGRAQAEASKAKKALLTRPLVATFYRFGAKEEGLIPGAFEAYRDGMLDGDPRSAEFGGQVRYPAGRLYDFLKANPQFDASKITVPTLVIRGAQDTFGSTEDSQRLTAEIGASIKKFVEIPNGSHNLPFEKVNRLFYQTVQDFLEGK